MSKSSQSRTALVEAAKALLWSDGYEATSPRRVLEASGVGQGSLYHHFPGKKALALTALDEVSDELIATLDAYDRIAEMDGARAALRAFFEAQRDGMKGCRLGRLANETAFADDELRAPLERFFSALKTRLTRWLGEIEDAGDAGKMIAPEALATMAIAAIQGGYVLSRIERSDAPLRIAAETAWTVIAQDYYSIEAPR